jgi:23S rRNA pseudouridine1911/1915/1917 synthase
LARENRTGNIYLATCHRLDRPVCGALIFVRNVRAAQRLSAQFENRTVDKSYWAIVQGNVSPSEGTWSDFMRKIPGQPRSEIVSNDRPDAQYALLHYRVRAAHGECTLLEIKLETGRTHQIRLQASARKHPIAGDQLYGSTLAFGPKTDDERARWIGLMAREIKFVHPMTKDPVSVRAPLMEPWRQELADWSLDQLDS